MNERLFKYGIFFLLLAFLLMGTAPLSSKAYGQWGYPNKILESVKKKKEKKKSQLKKSRKSSANSGKKVKEIDGESFMELRKPGESNQPLPKGDKHFQPELNSSKNRTIKIKKIKNKKRLFQGRQKIKKRNIIPPGTPPNERSERLANEKRSQQGTSYGGSKKVKRSEITEPGQGQKKGERNVREKQQEQGTAFSGEIRQKKGSVREPGIHPDDRPKGLFRRYTKSSVAASHEGNKKIRKNEIPEPGTHHEDRSRSLLKRYRNKAGEGAFAGKQRVKKNEVLEPGTYHSDRSGTLKNKYRNKAGEGAFAGNGKVAKKDLRAPGTHHLDRKMNQAEQYESTKAANHSGGLPVKKKYIKEPGIHHSERKASFAKQYSSYAATGFEGNVRAMSRKEKSRYYEKQSEKVHQFEGSIKINKNTSKMHPSVAARKAVVMRSREQVERSRNFHRWWNRLWAKEQPEVVTKKPRKARYDGEESEIWDKSRDW